MSDQENAAAYIREALTFLKKFKWLHNVPLTKILINDSLDKIPFSWLNILERLHYGQLNDFVTKLDMQCNWPTSLIEFLNSCRKMNKLPTLTIPLLSTNLPMIFTKNLNLKKQHEILYFSQLIHENCLLQKISVIVDIGTGLGYVSQLLNYLYGYKILGLDSSHQNTEKAKFRQKYFFPDSLSTVKYVCVKINEGSDKLIKSILEKEFQETDKICVIGLHACGDLSINVSKMYLKMEMAQLLVLVSCCYHKLNYKEIHENNIYNKREFFHYFPLSNVLKNIIHVLSIDIGILVKRTFMRLASQETSDRWITIDHKCHDKHSLHVLSRAVLELHAYSNGLKLKKLVRKGSKKSECINFECYLKDSMIRYEHEKDNNQGNPVIKIPWTHEMRNNILSMWKNNNEKLISIEPYTALQMILQKVVESLVLLDRVYFLKEHKCDTALFPFTNRSLSPRCFALISSKMN